MKTYATETPPRHRETGSAERLRQLLGGEEVEEHQDVGLLAGLIAADVFPLRFQDAVEPLDAVRRTTEARARPAPR